MAKVLYTGFEGPWANRTELLRLTSTVATQGDTFEWLLANNMASQNTTAPITFPIGVNTTGFYYWDGARTKSGENGMGTTWSKWIANGSHALGINVNNMNVLSGFGAQYFVRTNGGSPGNTNFARWTMGSPVSTFDVKFDSSAGAIGGRMIIRRVSPAPSNVTIAESAPFTEAYADDTWYSVSVEVTSAGVINFQFNGFTATHDLQIGNINDLNLSQLNGMYMLGTGASSHIDDITFNDSDNSDGNWDIGKPKAHRFYNVTRLLSAAALNGTGQITEQSVNGWSGNAGTAFEMLTDFDDATFAKADTKSSTLEMKLPIYESTEVIAASSFQDRLAVLRTTVRNVNALDNRVFAVTLDTGSTELTGLYAAPIVGDVYRSTTYYSKSAGAEFNLADFNALVAKIKYVD